MSADRPLAIDMFCGLGGWTDGLLAEGWQVIGFDVERHVYGPARYPAQLVIQDVLTLHGSQFRDADLIVASPPCQAYSYRAMPWSRAKALPPPDNTLFDACFRIQREACDAGGKHIPLVVENVRGAQKWVGPARWRYGSFYLWGDVPALMPMARGAQLDGLEDGLKLRDQDGYERNHPWKFGWKVPRTSSGSARKAASLGCGDSGIKVGGDWFSATDPNSPRRHGSKSNARKAASAMIAKIPLPLSRHIAQVFRPGRPGIGAAA